MITWIKKNDNYYASADGQYQLTKFETRFGVWHLQDFKYKHGHVAVATAPTLVLIKKEATRHARAQSFSERVKEIL